MKFRCLLNFVRYLLIWKIKDLHFLNILESLSVCIHLQKSYYLINGNSNEISHVFINWFTLNSFFLWKYRGEKTSEGDFVTFSRFEQKFGASGGCTPSGSLTFLTTSWQNDIWIFCFTIIITNFPCVHNGNKNFEKSHKVGIDRYQYFIEQLLITILVVMY